MQEAKRNDNAPMKQESIKKRKKTIAFRIEVYEFLA